MQLGAVCPDQTNLTTRSCSPFPVATDSGTPSLRADFTYTCAASSRSVLLMILLPHLSRRTFISKFATTDQLQVVPTLARSRLRKLRFLRVPSYAASADKATQSASTFHGTHIPTASPTPPCQPILLCPQPGTGRSRMGPESFPGPVFRPTSRRWFACQRPNFHQQVEGLQADGYE